MSFLAASPSNCSRDPEIAAQKLQVVPSVLDNSTGFDEYTCDSLFRCGNQCASRV